MSCPHLPFAGDSELLQTSHSAFNIGFQLFQRLPGTQRPRLLGCLRLQVRKDHDLEVGTTFCVHGFAVMMSMNQSSASIPGYSCNLVKVSRNMPSVVLITFALVTAVTRVRPVYCMFKQGNYTLFPDGREGKVDNDILIIISRGLPTAYAPCVFTEEDPVMFSAGTLTGRTFAKRSSSYA